MTQHESRKPLTGGNPAKSDPVGQPGHSANLLPPDRVDMYRNEIVRNARNTPADTSDQARLAELLYQIAEGQDVQHAADRIEKDTPFVRFGRAIRRVDREHPPSWAAWLAGLLIPMVMPISGILGLNTPSSPPPRPTPVVRESTDPPLLPPPDPDLVRTIVGQLSPQALEGLSPQQRIERAQQVFIEINEMFPHQAFVYNEPPQAFVYNEPPQVIYNPSVQAQRAAQRQLAGLVDDAIQAWREDQLPDKSE
jgi:hypothetical protein